MMPEGAQHLRAREGISANSRVPAFQLICYNSGTLKICLNLLPINQPTYLPKDSYCDCGIHSNISMMFIYTMHLTSFDYRSLLNVTV